MHRVPVLVIAVITVNEEGELPAGNQAGLWGSVLPAAWSLSLALRARGRSPSTCPASDGPCRGCR